MQVSSCEHTWVINYSELRHLSGFQCLLLLNLSPALQSASDASMFPSGCDRVGRSGDAVLPDVGLWVSCSGGHAHTSVSLLYGAPSPSSDGSDFDPAFSRAILFSKSGTLTRLRMRGWGGKSQLPRRPPPQAQRPQGLRVGMRETACVRQGGDPGPVPRSAQPGHAGRGQTVTPGAARGKKRPTEQRHTGAQESSLERVTLHVSRDLGSRNPG